MRMLGSPGLDAWVNYYIIVGSTAGALTGLQFVVFAFISERRKITDITDINAFATHGIR